MVSLYTFSDRVNVLRPVVNSSSDSEEDYSPPAKKMKRVR